MKKSILGLLILVFSIFSLSAQSKIDLKNQYVQVLTPEAINLDSAETAWLPGQIQDSIKSNLQEYLDLKTVVDSKSEKELKKLQADSESNARNEDMAIELGKISTAKYGIFTKLRKTGTGYTVSIDFTDLTNGEHLTSVTSKDYSEAGYLYGSTGAIDELTLALGNNLKKYGIQISDLNKNKLTSGSASFSVDDQIALTKQNEAQFKKLMSSYDAELSKLMTSNDVNAILEKNRIEAEKAILEEKQNSEKKRQQELLEQKKRVEADEKLEVERSIALKTQRDQMSKAAAAKAAEVRKLKLEKQGVLGQIDVIESKKKALVEIRQDVETRSQELYLQLMKDRDSSEQQIRNKSFSTVELGSDGNPTEAAKVRRENQIIKSYEDLTEKYLTDCEGVKQSTMIQQNALLTEIRSNQKSLATVKTVSSLGEELNVSFGTYEGSKNGWNAYLSLYSDGILLFTDSFIVNYETLSGKKAPDMANELDDKVIEEYADNVDMYNSLLVRGDPIIYFEIDYSVTPESDDKPSQYNFSFNKIRVINTVTGKTVQTSSLSKVQARTMKPEWDLREKDGIVAEEKINLDELKKYISYGMDLNGAKSYPEFQKSFVKIPKKNYLMMKTEVTQKLYSNIMGSNPSHNKGEDNPVENVSWYDAIYFCNKLSEKYGFIPVYSVNGTTDVKQWNYDPSKYNEILKGKVELNILANGFRLPTLEEWEYAAKGGENYKYSGSDKIEDVGWNYGSGGKTHPVAQKKANGYGLYDMSGNVEEWLWDSYDADNRLYRGGSYDSHDNYCQIFLPQFNTPIEHKNIAYSSIAWLGFRIACASSDKIAASTKYKTIIGDQLIQAQELLKKKELEQEKQKEKQMQKELELQQKKEQYKRKVEEAEQEVLKIDEFSELYREEFVEIPGKSFAMLKTEVTQKLYDCIRFGVALKKSDMGDYPVTNVSWYDAIYFCNELSERYGLTPVYSVNGTTDVIQWNYKPNHGDEITEVVKKDDSANGFRLPSDEEWMYAAKGGKNYKFSGSKKLNDVGWFYENSQSQVHRVAEKMANDYGLYDMSGNVSEWIWDSSDDVRHRSLKGGNYTESAKHCEIGYMNDDSASYSYDSIGFRIVCSLLDFNTLPLINMQY